MLTAEDLEAALQTVTGLGESGFDHITLEDLLKLGVESPSEVLAEAERRGLVAPRAGRRGSYTFEGEEG